MTAVQVQHLFRGRKYPWDVTNGWGRWVSPHLGHGRPRRAAEDGGQRGPQLERESTTEKCQGRQVASVPFRGHMPDVAQGSWLGLQN